MLGVAVGVVCHEAVGVIPCQSAAAADTGAVSGGVAGGAVSLGSVAVSRDELAVAQEHIAHSVDTTEIGALEGTGYIHIGVDDAQVATLGCTGGGVGGHTCKQTVNDTAACIAESGNLDGSILNDQVTTGIGALDMCAGADGILVSRGSSVLVDGNGRTVDGQVTQCVEHTTLAAGLHIQCAGTGDGNGVQSTQVQQADLGVAHTVGVADLVVALQNNGQRCTLLVAVNAVPQTEAVDDLGVL